MNKPNLFLIGAMKSGTTTLHELLAVHPEISMSDPKEPCYFVPPDQLRTLWPEMWRKGFFKDESSYLSLFGEKPHARYVGESSTDYSKQPRISGVPEAIHAYAPDARIIYVMRDPVERTISHYWHMVEHRGEVRRPLQAIQEEPHYSEVSHYSRQLEPYIRLFGMDHVYALTFEELKRAPLVTMQAVYRWLDVASDFVPTNFTQAHNVTQDLLAQKRRSARWLDRFRYSAPWVRMGPAFPVWFRNLGRSLVERKVVRSEADMREVVNHLRNLQLEQTLDLSRLLNRTFPEWTTLYRH